MPCEKMTAIRGSTICAKLDLRFMGQSNVRA